MMKKTLAVFASSLAVVVSGVAGAKTSTGKPTGAGEVASAPQPDPSLVIDARRDVPFLAFAYTAFGASPGTWGVQGFSSGLIADQQGASIGGGATVWAAPLDRLTLIADARRGMTREFTPSIAGIVRLYGRPGKGLTIGALGKFKVEGFDTGPNRDEVESEIEAGGLISYIQAGWQLDVNAIGGRGLGDDGDTDAELRIRMGRDVGSGVRVGLDGQARLRMTGANLLPNGRTWDLAAGPQLVIAHDQFFGAMTAGPSTMGLVSRNIGWMAILSLGGTSF